MKRVIFAGLTVLFSISLLTSCSSSDNDSKAIKNGTTTTLDTNGTPVEVSLKEYRVLTDQKSIPAGDTVFNVYNDGTIEHEFVVFKTDLDPKNLPLNSEGRVDEEGKGLDHIDEIPGLEKDSFKQLSINLPAGN